MFSRLLKAAQKAGIALDRINYTISGAMPLKKKDAQAWASATNAPVIEGYGMTETSPIVTGSPLSSTRVGTLGLPFPSIQVRLVSLEDPTKDVDDEAGEPGELIV
ncbi:AMP-binding protein, partial [Bacillus cereus]|uniref:AMP-binding protein n=1 Tax=Bacillus cereus TaxID=1396 RepID=UPI0028529357